jgi:transcriptional regulator GlxA family with amidase domain
MASRPAATSHAQTVRRALAIANARAGSRVRIRDLCGAVGVSERTLRNAFHDVLGVSPKQYMQRHGLETARQRLELARGARVSVTDVATECGFFELGRFAAAYRERFGERPSDTVRRGEVLSAFLRTSS